MKLALEVREVGHVKVCLASACISAIENLRDDPEESTYEFTLAMQDSYHLTLAHEYLQSRLSDCKCPEVPDPCPRCGHNYDITTLVAVHEGRLKADPMPTHACESFKNSDEFGTI